MADSQPPVADPGAGAPRPNLVLLGYRGAGKSTLARKLTRLLRLPLLSTDETLVKRFGRPIADEVAEKGWPAFRDAESEVVKEAARSTGTIIDCGGGVVEREGNIAALRASGIVFYLCGNVKTLSGRIGQSKHRPSLTGSKSAEAEVAEVLARRDPLYRAAAHHLIDVNGRRFFTAAEAIARRYLSVAPMAAGPVRPKTGGPGRRRRFRPRRRASGRGGPSHPPAPTNG